MTSFLPGNGRIVTVVCDTREPQPHPWARYLPANVRLARGTLETGDFSLRALPHGAVVERKTPGDLAGCLGRDRERFERELVRSRYAGRMAVVVEGTLGAVVVAGRGRLHENAIVGSIASWTLRYGVAFVFCETVAVAANFAMRFLLCQIRDFEKMASALEKDVVGGDCAPMPEKLHSGLSDAPVVATDSSLPF